MNTLPTYISYVSATETRGDYFAIEIRQNGVHVLRKKTTQSKSVKTEDKLAEAKSILVSELRNHPEWGIVSLLLNDPTIDTNIASHKILPTGVSSLPKYVRYAKATATRGDGFEYERKTADERILFKSTKSKEVSLDDKYKELLATLAKAGISV